MKRVPYGRLSHGQEQADEWGLGKERMKHSRKGPYAQDTAYSITECKSEGRPSG